MDANPKKRKKINYKLLISFILIIIAVILLIAFLVNGETTINGNFPDNEKTSSITCKSSAVEYPFFTTDGSSRKDFEIKVIADDDKVSSISLIAQLYYNDEEAIKKSYDENHAAMNKSFEKSNLEADALGANYVKLKNSFKFSLFAKANDLNINSLKYFLLDKMSSKNGVKYTSVKNAYETLGFSCVETN